MPLAEQNASLPTSDLVQRPEIGSALQGIPATAVRRVLGSQRVLYAAAPIYADGWSHHGHCLHRHSPARGRIAHKYYSSVAWRDPACDHARLRSRDVPGRQIARPLEELATAATSIARGDLQARVPTDSNIAELDKI